MDTDRLNSRSIYRSAANFLRKEAFYVAVVLLVGAMGFLQTALLLVAEPIHPTGSVPIDAIELQNAHGHRLMELIGTAPQTVRFARVFSAVETGLFHAGLLTLLVLLVLRIARGRLLPARHLTRPAWGMWDFVKTGALFIAGLWVFNWIFGTPTVAPFAYLQPWVAGIFGQVLLAGVVLNIILGDRGGRLEDLGIRREGIWRGIGIGLLTFLILQPIFPLIQHAQSLTQYLITKQPPVQPLQESVEALLTTQSTAIMVLGTIMAIIMAPVTEELFYRGMLQPALRRWVDPMTAIVFSAAFFAAAHMDLYSMPALFLLGLALGYLYNRTQSLVAPVTLHLAHNTMVILTVFAYRSVAAAGG